MVVAYGLLAFFANIALLINLMLLLLSFRRLASLDPSGIAGMCAHGWRLTPRHLFERCVRVRRADGLNHRNWLQVGIATILDSNLTRLCAVVLIGVFRPRARFAITLASASYTM